MFFVFQNFDLGEQGLYNYLIEVVNFGILNQLIELLVFQQFQLLVDSEVLQTVIC